MLNKILKVLAIIYLGGGLVASIIGLVLFGLFLYGVS